MNKKDWEGYIYNYPVQELPRGINPTNFKAVALAMAYHSDWKTLENVSVSMQTIAKETSLHRNTVDKMVNAMMDIGLAARRDEKRVWSTAGGTKWTWVYDLHIMDSHPVGLHSDESSSMDSHLEQMDSHLEQMDSHLEQMDSHLEQMDSHLGVNNHTYNHTKDHTSNHTSNHTAQDGDGNRGCDGTEPTGTQTASQQSSDLTKGDAHSPDSSEATARAAAAQTSQEATREENEPKDNATASLDLKTNAADSKTSSADSKTGSAELDSKTSSADSDSEPTWQEMVDADERKARLNLCPVCNVPLRKTDEEKWCPQSDCIRKDYDAKEGRKVARKYKIDELVEAKTNDEARELFKMKQEVSEEWF